MGRYPDYYSYCFLYYLSIFCESAAHVFWNMVGWRPICTTYLEGRNFTFRSIMPYALVLFTIITLLLVNLGIHYAATQKYIYPYSSYPFLEVHHFVFATLVMFAAVIWKKLKWIGFIILY